MSTTTEENGTTNGSATDFVPERIMITGGAGMF
jgi:hypothetical protein